MGNWISKPAARPLAMPVPITFQPGQYPRSSSPVLPVLREFDSEDESTFGATKSQDSWMLPVGAKDSNPPPAPILRNAVDGAKYPDPVLSAASAEGDGERYTVTVDEVMQRLLAGGLKKGAARSKTFPVPDAEIVQISTLAREVFLAQPTVLHVRAPVKIVGDLNGQFADLLGVFEASGYPPATSYVFLGNYVGLGPQSLETLLVVLCLKLRHPENVVLLRGNQECGGMSLANGFYQELRARGCMPHVWRALVAAFDTMPVAAVVMDRVFCVHAGVSPHLAGLADIEALVRPTSVLRVGLMNDLLWGDPVGQSTVEQSPVEQSPFEQSPVEQSPAEEQRADFHWEKGEGWGVLQFNERAVDQFLGAVGADMVVRGHEVKQAGFEFFHGRKLVTLFSAPEHAKQTQAWGAVMCVDESLQCTFEMLEPLNKKERKEELRRLREKHTANTENN